MAGKRKRKRPGQGWERVQKRQKLCNSHGSEPVVQQALLAKYYPQVMNLRVYLLSKLPSTSKVRRKKISSVGRRPEDTESEQQLSRFLDQTLIGVSTFREASQDERWKHWTTFSQRSDESTSFANSSGVGPFSQDEIVDFAIWLLFSKTAPVFGKLPHLLCQGFRKNVSRRSINQGEKAAATIPGVISTYPNSHVTSMKAQPWTQVLILMGKEGERAMIDLILDCGVFLAIESGHGTFHQLSGIPLGDLQCLPAPAPKNIKEPRSTTRTPSNINFVRNRMMYARAALNSKLEVRFGLRHIHVLNRYPLPKKLVSNQAGTSSVDPTTIQVMMYIFPRQFGLHNVFTSNVDPLQTVQPFQDYTLREDEMNTIFRSRGPRIPRRLRGKATELVRKLQVQHKRCPYKLLLEHYCPIDDTSLRIPTLGPSPVSSAKFKTQIPAGSDGTQSTLPPMSPPMTPARKPSMMNHATPTAMVSAFCRAALSRLIPSEFWGAGATQAHNERTFNKNVDRFIGLRRFESLSLHEVTQGLKISDIPWLAPPNATNNPSQSDTAKRWELLHELVYYIFDSLLLPLLRSNFHITESNVHRYRLFYFRHDVWRSLAEPALASLKLSMFEEVKLGKAQEILSARALGYSQVRLLPKEAGVRPIMNLRRRPLKAGSKTALGMSINSVLAPVYNVLTYEKNANPARLGATLFSVSDLYTKLKTFKSRLPTPCAPLYFAKLDVTAAFDTIPQHAILALLSTIPSQACYRIAKHCELRPSDSSPSSDLPTAARPLRKYPAYAHPSASHETLAEQLSAPGNPLAAKRNTIFVESIVNHFRDTQEILSLLREHISHNLVKIGKKFYRQKSGIPQGSVVSSLLCNYFYADLESAHLGFLKEGQDAPRNLLLRLVDDFLLITTDVEDARHFLEVMHQGVAEYGVRVNPEKTLVNFEVCVGGKKVPRVLGGGGFPYCGSWIDMQNLDISRDLARRGGMPLADSLTVEYSRVPGKAFQKKVLNTFKIQAHAMYLDTSFNSLATVRANLARAFSETAMKMYMYMRCLPGGKRPSGGLVIRTIKDLVTLAVALLQSKARNCRKGNGGVGVGVGVGMEEGGFQCQIRRPQLEGLVVDAFREVLGPRQTAFGDVLRWLEGRRGVLRGGKGWGRRRRWCGTRLDAQRTGCADIDRYWGCV
ncbi:telomerase reverse transcriptase [Marssonina coronariae]|uniref:Telomerase reverse transcriptase n=1 Tax=Diplocarpon coronariae TaxID=2795749 RepID=A0A218Z3Y7_9HELO|nr:telomerase reverse transcriptase [Marssonina coronariae]